VGTTITGDVQEKVFGSAGLQRIQLIDGEQVVAAVPEAAWQHTAGLRVCREMVGSGRMQAGGCLHGLPNWQQLPFTS